MSSRLQGWLLGILWIGVLIACSTPLEPAVDLPSSSNIDEKARIEQLILAATVRMKLETWLVNENDQGYTILQAEGHGTVVNGRFLITHNHHNIPLSLSESGIDPDIYTRLIIYNVNGEQVNILPLTDFQIALREPQMLLLAYEGKDLPQPFGTEGLKPEQIKPWPDLLLTAGTEVAQIDWDGTTTTVNSTQITSIHTQNAPPCLELAYQPKVGASGGGIFWGEYHIANNWLTGMKINSETNLTCLYSKAVLNSTRLADFFTDVSP